MSARRTVAKKKATSWRFVGGVFIMLGILANGWLGEYNDHRIRAETSRIETLAESNLDVIRSNQDRTRFDCQNSREALRASAQDGSDRAQTDDRFAVADRDRHDAQLSALWSAEAKSARKAATIAQRAANAMDCRIPSPVPTPTRTP